MKVFLPEFYCYRIKVIKKTLFFITFLCCLLSLNAQVIFRIEPGILLDSDSNNLGLLLNIEPKVKASESTVIGLRFGISINPQKFDIKDGSTYFIDDLDDNGIISFVPTFDYYFTQGYHRPYIGCGLGFYLFNDIDVSKRNGSIEVLEGSVNNQLGFLLRAGLEVGNIRYGLEYNLIPKADIEIPDGQIIGTVNNSYLGLSIGFKIGGRKNTI